MECGREVKSTERFNQQRQSPPRRRGGSNPLHSAFFFAGLWPSGQGRPQAVSLRVWIPRARVRLPWAGLFFDEPATAERAFFIFREDAGV